MIRNPLIRRLLAGFCVVLGTLLMLFAPETWVGLLIFGLGIAIELIGHGIKPD